LAASDKAAFRNFTYKGQSLRGRGCSSHQGSEYVGRIYKDLLRRVATSARAATNRIIRKTSNHETIGPLSILAVSHFQIRDGG
jgi:hypothetical protein